MNRALKNMSIVFMAGQKGDKKLMAIAMEKEEQERVSQLVKEAENYQRALLFKGSTNALWFNQWLEEHLIPELKPNSTLILDNAAFHRKDDVFRIAEQAGHKVLFLPPYSPDFNRIEQDFAILKKRRIYSAPGTSLDDIIKSYGNYLE